jgi:hypothetical protein
VLGRDQVHAPGRAVRVQAGDAPAVHPESKVRSPFPGTQQHLFVVAQDRNETAAAGQGNQLVDHAPAVDTPVHVVTQRDDGVVRLRRDGLDQLRQGDGTAVYVTDGDGEVFETRDIFDAWLRSPLPLV